MTTEAHRDLLAAAEAYKADRRAHMLERVVDAWKRNADHLEHEELMDVAMLLVGEDGPGAVDREEVRDRGPTAQMICSTGGIILHYGVVGGGQPYGLAIHTLDDVNEIERRKNG